MCSNYLYYQSFSSKSGKLFSVTNDGKLSFKGIHEIHSYMLSQGINYCSYSDESRDELYFLMAADSMVSLGENKWATSCYVLAIENAFRLQLESKLSNNGTASKTIPPMDIYRKATYYLNKLGDKRECDRFEKKILKFLKENSQP